MAQQTREIQTRKTERLRHTTIDNYNNFYEYISAIEDKQADRQKQSYTTRTMNNKR